jgi:dTDP-glucose pyrophosphorylase/ketosteroid isomerase-like protein
MLNIVIPMAGRGSRFASAHFSQPKPLINVAGKPMIEWIIDNVRPDREHRFIFVCLEEHLISQPEVAEALRRICPGCEIRTVGAVTEGAACTVLTVKDLINSEEPLMIANSDQYVALDINDYLVAGDAEGVAGLIMTFWSDDPKWSYCGMRDDGSVGEVVEKQVVSNEATVGIYNFRHGRDFVSAAEEMIAKNLRVNNEFYVAPAYNQMIERGDRIVVARTGREYDGMHGLGIPQDLAHFMTTDLFRRALERPAWLMREQSLAYARAFDRKDLAAISEMLVTDFTLEDPAGRFDGREKVLAYIQGIFDSHPDLAFEVLKVHVSEADTTILEFRLRLNGKVLLGTDVMEWRAGKIAALRAFLHEAPEQSE